MELWLWLDTRKAYANFTLYPEKFPLHGRRQKVHSALPMERASSLTSYNIKTNRQDIINYHTIFRLTPCRYLIMSFARDFQKQSGRHATGKRINTDRQAGRQKNKCRGVGEV